MSVFTEKEIAYLGGQRLGRLATVDGKGNPHVVPVSFRFNPEMDTVDIGGRGMSKSKKLRDVAGHPQVAFVVDDVLPPWRPRMIEIRGRADIESGPPLREGFDPQIIRIRPRRIVAFGIEAEGYAVNARDVASQPSS